MAIYEPRRDASEEAEPTHTMAVDFQPPEEINFCWYFVMAEQSSTSSPFSSGSVFLLPSQILLNLFLLLKPQSITSPSVLPSLIHLPLCLFLKEANPEALVK